MVAARLSNYVVEQERNSVVSPASLSDGSLPALVLLSLSVASRLPLHPTQEQTPAQLCSVDMEL